MMSQPSNGVEGSECLEALSKDQLIELLQVYSKNLVAMDGVWFQSIEAKSGMDEALFHDVEAWKRFTVSEARRIKEFLKLPDNAGLDGLEQALALKFTSIANRYEVIREDNTLTFRIIDCRVQNARARKGMEFHPCKSVGLAEYAGFARTIDERITCECLSCFPEMIDDSCNCAWKFEIPRS